MVELGRKIEGAKCPDCKKSTIHFLYPRGDIEEMARETFPKDELSRGKFELNLKMWATCEDCGETWQMGKRELLKYFLAKKKGN